MLWLIDDEVDDEWTLVAHDAADETEVVDDEGLEIGKEVSDDEVQHDNEMDDEGVLMVDDEVVDILRLDVALMV